MNREEILAKAQKENKNTDLVNLKIIAESERLAGGIAGIICFMLYAAEIIITGNKNYSLWGIFSTFVAVEILYKGIKTKDKFFIIFGVVLVCAAAASITKAVITFVNTGRA